MIARHDTGLDRADVWQRLAEPVDESAIGWRQDGKVIQRDGRYLARFVAYIEANTVRERLDAVVPGEWDLTLELLPPIASGDDPDSAACTFKARLQILGVIREDVGFGRDYKSASTDAFKRAAVRFGIGHELYSYEQNWVEMDGDGRYARPVEDPAAAYARRLARKAASGSRSRKARVSESPASERSGEAAREEAEGTLSLRSNDTPDCPVCGGRMWDNRLTKRNPKAPDFKCRDRNCEGVIWPARSADEEVATVGAGAAAESGAARRSGSASGKAQRAASRAKADSDMEAEAVPENPDAELPF
jgi:hypothetical protein